MDILTNATCEHCGKARATHGVVPYKKIREVQPHVKFSDREAAIFLLENGEHGKPACGQFLCKECFEERRKKRGQLQ